MGHSERRIRLAAIGCGSHCTRNILPTFRYCPVDLVAVCDLDEQRARDAARSFGAGSSYTDHQRMLAEVRPDAVTVVTNYDAQGRPLYPAIAIDCMNAGTQVWIEKPPAGSSREILEMIRVSQRTGRFVAVGLKKMFAPANTKAREIIARPEFGAVSTITARYPQYLPPIEDRRDPLKMLGFLDHIVHPYSVLRLFAGPIESICVERSPQGGSVTSIRFVSGAVGSLHLSHGQSCTGTLERTEIVGQHTHLVVENNLRVTWYRASEPTGPYGQAETFYGAEETAPLTWEPEFSLGQLYSKGIFLLGYVPEMKYFCRCVLDSVPPSVGNLDDAMELLRIYEAYCQPDGRRIGINPR